MFCKSVRVVNNLGLPFPNLVILFEVLSTIRFNLSSSPACFTAVVYNFCIEGKCFFASLDSLTIFKVSTPNIPLLTALGALILIPSITLSTFLPIAVRSSASVVIFLLFFVFLSTASSKTFSVFLGNAIYISPAFLYFGAGAIKLFVSLSTSVYTSNGIF